MGSAKKSSSQARQARIAEMRRAEQARERRGRLLTIGVSAVVVAGLVVGGVLLVRSRSDDPGGTASDGKGAGTFVTGEDGVRTWKGTLSRNHVTKDVTYPMKPPVAGDHQVWMNCDGDVYDKALDDKNAVHALEHGAVWGDVHRPGPEGRRRRAGGEGGEDAVLADEPLPGTAGP
ncbi:hypothetical protein SFUMM280S_03809 [Streptomyces fumanus]